MNWLRTQPSVSKTKVARRKYSLLILKLHCVLAIPAAHTCSVTCQSRKMGAPSPKHILDAECFRRLCQTWRPGLKESVLAPVLCNIILCNSGAKVSMKAKFSSSQESCSEWKLRVSRGNACCPFPEVCVCECVCVCVQPSACLSGDML